jgi:hypothetical protein
MSKYESPFPTLEDYWVDQGFSRKEAKEIAREQIEHDMKVSEEEELYEAGIWNA